MSVRQIVLLAVLVATAASKSVWAMSGEEIANLIVDKKVLLSTSYGKMPLRYRSDKSVVGDGSNTGLIRFFAPKETGKWWIADDRLCQQWPSWYKGKPFCFTIKKTSENSIRWVREDGYSGTAKISK